MGTKFTGKEGLLGVRIPVARPVEPASRPFGIIVIKLAWIDRWLARVRICIPHGREWDHTALALAARPSAIDENLENPGLERRAAFEAVDAVQNSDPGFLRHLFGNLL